MMLRHWRMVYDADDILDDWTELYLQYGRKISPLIIHPRLQPWATAAVNHSCRGHSCALPQTQKMQTDKHTKLARPALGRYGRNEWAILGAPCGIIQSLAADVIHAFSGRYACAWLDADHAAADQTLDLPGMLAAGARMEWTDQINSQRLQMSGMPALHRFRTLFNDSDLVLLNGNHHEAAAQIVILDPAKENSLRKRLNQLTNVRLILRSDPAVPVFDFLKEHLPGLPDIPQLDLADRQGILRFFEQEMNRRRPPLHGLVLAGGQSRRMGRDKGEIRWHGRPQREYLADLLRPLCGEVYLSARAGQQIDSAVQVLTDTFADLGPYGAILSAFRSQPDAAWLVVACDLPLLDAETLRFLADNRAVGATATAFRSPHDDMPEPLIAIWEPKSYAQLLSFLAQGYSCPRKVLLNTDTRLLDAPRAAALTNVNTPEELEKLGFNLLEL